MRTLNADVCVYLCLHACVCVHVVLAYRKRESSLLMYVQGLQFHPLKKSWLTGEESPRPDA